MRKNLEWAILGVLLAILFIASLYVVRPVLDAVIVAAFFAYLAYPIADRLEGFIKNRTLAAIIVVCLAVVPLVLLSIEALHIYSNEFKKLAALRFSSTLIDIDWNAISESIMAEVQSRLSPEKVLRGISFGIELLIKVFIVVAGSFYMLKEKIALRRFLVSLAPQSKEHIVSYFFETTDKIFYGLFFGHLITSIITGFIAGVGFYLIGRFMDILALSTYPFFLGVFTAVATLLPIVGAWLVYLPISIFLFLIGETSQSIVVFFFGITALSVLPDIIVRPYISGKKGKTHPFIVLLGFICGPIVFGPLGLILGPAILGLFKATLDTYRDMVLEKT